MRILVIEDNPLIRKSLVSRLKEKGDIIEADNFEQAKETLVQSNFDLCFIDLNLDIPMCGLDLIKIAVERGFYSVVLSSHEEDDIIRQAYLSGVKDYYIKDGDLSKIDDVLSAYHYNTRVDSSLHSFLSEKFITQDEDTITDLKYILTDHRDLPLFISGPSGIGKSMVAQFIHDQTKGEYSPFVHVNCSSFTETLLESELFGHVKGAFTGAHKDKKGCLERAHNGTLFLDEVSTMPLSLQTKLLLALESKEFTPVGGEKTIKSNFRIMSATWENMGELIQEKKFRFDLFSRINEQKLSLKPLSERVEDIPLLIEHFLKRQRRILIEPQAMAKLKKYPWPGNVRELKQAVNKLLGLRKGIVDLEDIPVEYTIDPRDSLFEESFILSPEQIRFIEKFGLKFFIKRVQTDAKDIFLKKNQNNKTAALKELRVSKSLFYENILSRKQLLEEQNGLLH